MNGLLSEKVAVITGGARGVGEATARLFARHGAIVHAWDVRPDVADTVRSIKEGGGEATAHIVDITDCTLTHETAQAIIQKDGRIDVLVNCAGIVSESAFLDMGQDDWDRVLAVNLNGTANCCRAVLPNMVHRRSGTIVNIGSVTGPRTIIADSSHYAASKGAVSALTKALAVEMGPHGITVNAILPGTIDTPMLREASAAAGRDADRALAQMASSVPLRRLGRPEDVAGACLMLASQYASYISGAEIIVDGAYTLLEWV